MNALLTAPAELNQQEKVDLLMTGCFPRQHTPHLIKLFKRSTLKLAAAAVEGVGARSSADALRTAATEITALSFMHPLLSVLIRRSDQLVKQYGTTELQACVDQVLAPTMADSSMRDRIDDVRLYAGGTFNWAEVGIQHQAGQLKADLGDDQGWVLGSVLAREASAYFECANDAITEVWPELAEQHEALLARIVYFTAQSFWSSSDPWTYGAVYVNPQRHWSLAHYVETLLHEIGHHALMMFEAVAPLVTNGAQRVASPLRKDLRPISGVLHATFVLTRMTEGLSRLADAGIDADAAIGMAGVNYQRLLRGLDVLEQHAVLTANGLSLVSEMRLMCNSFRERLL